LLVRAEVGGVGRAGKWKRTSEEGTPGESEYIRKKKKEKKLMRKTRSPQNLNKGRKI